MNLTTRQLLVLTQLTDSMFPSGGFVHSEGLETFVQSGQVEHIEQLEAILRTRLRYDWATQDMIALQCASSAYHKQDMTFIRQLDEQLTAMKIAKETRLASHRVGRQTLRTVLMLYQDDLLTEYQRQITDKTVSGHQAIVFGLVTAMVDIEAAPALTAYAYNIVSSQVSIALKLMRFGQTQAQQLLWNLHPAIDEAVSLAEEGTIDTMQSFVPSWDIRAMQHEYLFRRLFNS